MKLLNLLFLLNLLTYTVHADPLLIDHIVAVVNNEVITHTALQQDLTIIVQENERKGLTLPPQSALEKQVLDNMILTTLQLQAAKNTGISVSDNELNDALLNIAKKEDLTLEGFKARLEEEGYDYELFRKNSLNQMIITRLIQREIISRINVTDREIDNFIANQEQQGAIAVEYHLQHILIGLPEAASPEIIDIKRKEAEAVVAKLRAGEDFRSTAMAVSNSSQALEGGDLGWLAVPQIPTVLVAVVNQLSVGEISDPVRDTSGFHIVKVADKRSAEQNVVTQSKVRHILIQTNEAVSDDDAKIRLDRLKYRIDQGEDFSEVARANSEDSSSAFDGGLLDWVTPGTMVPEFETVMDSLSINEVSQPFKSRFGWHVVQVLERRQHDNTDTALRTQATQYIKQRKVEEELQSWQRQLRDEAYIENRLSS